MGKIFSSIFGGGRSKSKSQQTSQSASQQTSLAYNQAYPFIKDKYSGQVDSGLRANDFVSNLLGLGGNAAAGGALQAYKQSAGYDSILNDGRDQIEGSRASKGMLKSGATLKGLDEFRQKTNSQFFNNYLDRLLGLSGQGLGAGGLIANSGQTSQSQGTSSSYSQGTSNSSSYQKDGLGKFLGSMMSAAAASERHLKTDIIRLGELESGLPYYSFRYKDKPERHIGVMVDEVREIQPSALGEIVDGIQTVNYDKITGWFEGARE